MTNPRLASRYAQSLLDIAEEQKNLSDVLNDMKFIKSTINNSRELELFLSSPIIKADKKINAITQLFEGKVSALTIKFIQLLIQKGRESNLYEIAGSFESIYDEKHKLKKIKVTSAVPMNDEIKAKVMKIAQSIAPDYELKIEEIIDTDIIGGFIIEIGDKLYDASIKTELFKIKKQFQTNEYIANF